MPASRLTPQAASLLWGLFCACSWTWCIGMYLPRLMIERFGWPGFIVFAVPNVLGCAAFGYVVRNRERSEAMVARHGRMMTAFSAVTIAYHMFFIVWLFSELIGGASAEDAVARPLAAAVIVFLLGLVLSFLDNRDWLVLAALVYGFSLVTFVVLGFEPLKTIPWAGREPAGDLAWMTPTIVCGFLLCPYLDLTFHRAIQNSPGRHAFIVFGITFFVMLLLTCVIWFSDSTVLPGIALGHILAQCVFTVGAHVREIRMSPAIRTRDWRWLVLALPLLGAPLLFIATPLATGDHFGADTYIRFLVFYGLVFPAYVLLVPRFSGRKGAHPGRVVVAYALFVLFSMPCYEWGFLRGRAWLLALPMAALIVVTLLPANASVHEKTPGGAGG